MKKINEVITLLKKEYKVDKPFLNFETDFQLLVSVILSAQCTDARVNIVTKELFKKVNHPKDLLKLSQKQLENYVYQTGFYRNKAKYLKATAEILEKKFKGIVPSTMEELLTLRGVSRKTANVVLGYLFNLSTYLIAHGRAVCKAKNPSCKRCILQKLCPSAFRFEKSL